MELWTVLSKLTEVFSIYTTYELFNLLKYSQKKITAEEQPIKFTCIVTVLLPQLLSLKCNYNWPRTTHVARF